MSLEESLFSFVPNVKPVNVSMMKIPGYDW